MKKVTFNLDDVAFNKLLDMALIFKIKPSSLIEMLIFSVDVDMVLENLDNQE